MKDEKDIHPIDKIFRQSLEGAAPAPPFSVWKGIRSRIPKPKLSFGKFLSGPGGLSAVSFVLIVAASWLIYKSFAPSASTATKSASHQVLTSDTIVEKQVTTGKIISSNETKKETRADSGIDLEKNSITVDKNENTASYQNMQKQQTEKPPVKQKGTKTAGIKNNSTQAQQKPGLQEANSASARQAGEKGNTAVQNSPVTIQPKAEINEQDKTTAIDTTSKSVAINTNNPVDVPGPDSKQPDLVNIPVENKEPTKPLIQANEVAGQDSIAKNEKTNPGNVAAKKPENTPAADPDIKAASPALPANIKLRNFIYQAGAFGTIGQVYQKDRSANMFYGGSITGGVWNTKWKAGVETGVGLNKSKDYGTVENTWLKTDSIIKHDTIWHQQDSIIIPVIVDTVLYFQTTSFDVLNYSYTYTYLQIPLFITKQLANSGKFSLDLKAGPLVGFMISKNESVTHSNNSATGELTGSVIKNYTRLDMSWQLHFAPQLRWDIADNLSLGISPTAVLFLNNLYDKKNKPSSKPYGISIYGGVIYKIK